MSHKIILERPETSGPPNPPCICFYRSSVFFVRLQTR